MIHHLPFMNPLLFYADDIVVFSEDIFLDNATHHLNIAL